MKADSLKPLHKPLFESFSGTRFPSQKKPGIQKKEKEFFFFFLIHIQLVSIFFSDPFEGVLGRIPSHSVRAPRPLLQLKSEENEGTLTATSDQNVSVYLKKLERKMNSINKFLFQYYF